jgi:hypothetical protein
MSAFHLVWLGLLGLDWLGFILHLPLVTLGGTTLSDSEKPEALAANLEAQFQPVSITLDPAVIVMADMALMSYLLTPASEPKLTNHNKVQEAIRGLKVSNALGPNGIANRTLKHLPK